MYYYSGICYTFPWHYIHVDRTTVGLVQLQCFIISAKSGWYYETGLYSVVEKWDVFSEMFGTTNVQILHIAIIEYTIGPVILRSKTIVISGSEGELCL